MYAIHVLNHIVRNQWTWNIEKLPNEVEVNPLIHLSGIQAQGSHTKSFDTKREHSNDLKNCMHVSRWEMVASIQRSRQNEGWPYQLDKYIHAPNVESAFL